MKKYLQLFVYLLVWVWLCSLPAQAHWSDMAAMELDIQGQKAEGLLTLPTPFLNGADRNGDGKLSKAELIASLPWITKRLSQDLSLKGDRIAATLSIQPADSPVINTPRQDTQTTLRLHWQWEKPVSHYTLHYSLFAKDAPNAHCLVSATVNGTIKTLVFDQRTQVHVLQETSLLMQIKEFVTLGFEHILTGYDHILFLLALLLVGGRFWYLLKIVTAFTVAHSITLSLAVLGLVNAPPQIVESAIALSIVYVAAENLWRDAEKEAHWGLVFIFGLVHGLGFANILREMAVQKSELLVTLASFNIGIELGQMVIVILAWTLLKAIYSSQWFFKFKYAGSIAILLVATFWFVERAFLSG